MARYLVEQEHISYTHYIVEADSEEEAIDKASVDNYLEESDTGVMHSEFISATPE